MKTIKTNRYPIYIKKNLSHNIASYLTAYKTKSLFIITDYHVYSIYKNHLNDMFRDFKTTIIPVPEGETSKSLSTFESTVKKLIHHSIHKDDLLIAFGGGVIGDLTGFIAATLFRGMTYIQIPTTILAMVDSSIGGKTAINLSEGKNLIGVFHYPLMVIIDPTFITSLSDRQKSSGLAEIYKAALIKDSNLLSLLKDNHPIDETLIACSIKVKQHFVEQDNYDTHIRQILNFGHTFGHAIEHATHYHTYTHGECVAMGIIMALELGVKMKLTPTNLLKDITQLFIDKSLIKLPLLDYHDYIDGLDKDKKMTSEHLPFIFLKDYHAPVIKPINIEEIL